MDPPKRESTAIRWCFTVNNPVLSRKTYLAILQPNCKYCLIGKEIAPSGTMHYQGYMELNNRKRKHQVIDLFPPEIKPHVELCRGTPQQNITYCKEDGKWVEYGKPTAERTRSDLTALTTLIKDGATMETVALSSPATFVRNYNGLAKFKAIVNKPPLIREQFECHFYFGKTGAGKTYMAHEKYPELFAKPIGKGLWFDGYAGEETVLIDEFEGQYPLADMLRVCDRYRLQVEVKGSFAYFIPKLVIFTSNVHPYFYYNMWENRQSQFKAFARRFSTVLYFKDRDNVETVKPEDFFENYQNYLF